MPVFVLLVILGAGLLWLLLSFVFIPLGKAVRKLLDNAHRAINDNDPHNNENKGEM